MADVLHETPQEYWRPPLVSPAIPGPGLVEVCEGCETEFIAGAKFCHVCGATRKAKVEISGRLHWTRILDLLRALEFQNIKDRLGLSVPSLVAFFIGLGCVLAAIAVGLIYSVQTLADFQAIQLWRIQWLLGALVSFAAGILLRKADAVQK
jgi:hypothetical protein